MSPTEASALALVAVTGLWILGAYNRLVRLRQGVASSYGQVDAQFRQRHELLGALIEAAAAQLTDVPEAVAGVDAARRQARIAAEHAARRATSAGRLASLALAEQVLDTAQSRLSALVNERPAVRADARLHDALQRLAATQLRLAAARDEFNVAVLDYNRNAQQFPTRLVAGMFGFRAAGRL